MLRIAVPNKGSLSEAAATMLREAGYRQRADSRELHVNDVGEGVEFFYLRPRDIAVYVGSGDLDLGITGRDLLLDSRAAASEVLALGFGGSTFRLAARPGSVRELADLAGRRVATAYPGLLEKYFADQGIAAEVIRLDGAVENAVRLGVAEVVADVVSSGSTLRQAGLEIVGDPVLKSEAVLVRQDRSGDDPAVTQLIRRLQNVLVARKYVLMAYDVRADHLAQATRISPGIESPTVSPLAREGWVAVQVMIPRRDINPIMDELYAVGARAILVSDIYACRL
jgi:ATP phosphoribosyltransferase